MESESIMKQIEKEVTSKQIIYEITKDELDKIKNEERIKGRNDIIGYLIFAMKNYHLQLNLAGIQEVIKDIVDFLIGNTSIIRNIYGYSFKEYIHKYR